MRFKTHWGLTLTLAVLAGLFITLGHWQRDRALQKENLRIQFDAAPETTTLPTQPANFTRATVSGRYDQQRHIMLDNKLNQGRPGVEVLTPFYVSDGPVILVNRGWLAMPRDRSYLPAVPPLAAEVELHGRLRPIAVPGKRLGPVETLHQDQWPQLLVYPEMKRIEQAMDSDLYPFVLYLDANSTGGFEGRNWSPYSMGPDRHRGYAVQWYGLALTAFIIWLVLGFKAGRRITQ